MSYIELLQDPAPSNALVRALKALLDAPTREEAKSVLAREQALLLSDPALEILQHARIESLRTPFEGPYETIYLIYHLTLLETARVQGIERGWEAADAQAARFGGKREAMKTLTPDTFNNMLRGEL